MPATLLVAAAGSVGLLLAAGVGLGLGYAVQTEDVTQIGRLAGAALVYTPAVWSLVGALALLGGSVRLPDWATNLSPFQHTPRLPVDALAVAPLAVITVIAVGLTAGGVLALRRRDIG
ncbi:hypothetical protein BH18ACT7_BH18ACT7_10340 [soil metagenome]